MKKSSAKYHVITEYNPEGKSFQQLINECYLYHLKDNFSWKGSDKSCKT